MVTRPMARRRKSAQTKSESVNPSRKRRRGAGTFSRKMVISNDVPAPSAHTSEQKVTEVSRVPPNLNQFRFSGHPHNGQEDRVKQVVAIRQLTDLEIHGGGSPSEPIASDKLLEINNQERERYAGLIEPSSSDSERNGIKIGEYEEHEFYGLGASESHLEIFSHLRRKLKQLVVDGLSLPKEKGECLHLSDREQTSAEVMKRLDLLSEPWTNCSIDDKAGRRSTKSSDISSVSNPHCQFPQLRESNCKYPVDEQPRQAKLVQSINEEPQVDMNSTVSSYLLGRKYWNPASKADLLGTNEQSQNQEWHQLERVQFLSEQLRAPESRVQRHTQASDPMHAKLPCSPTMCTYTHLHTWQQCQESTSSHETPQTTTDVRTCSNGRHPPSGPLDCAVNLNDYHECFPAICAIAADDIEDCNSTARGQQAKTLPTHNRKLQEPWKNFQDPKILPTAVIGLFKNFSESPEAHFAQEISTKPNEIILSTFVQAPTHRANPERDLYDYSCWDTMPATMDCQAITFTCSEDCKLTDEAERSEFPALHDLEFCTLEYRADGEPEPFHCISPDPPSSRDHFEGLSLSSLEFSDYDWLSETAGDYRAGPDFVPTFVGSVYSRMM